MKGTKNKRKISQIMKVKVQIIFKIKIKAVFSAKLQLGRDITLTYTIKVSINQFRLIKSFSYT